jgi:hypothetical protein
MRRARTLAAIGSVCLLAGLGLVIAKRRPSSAHASDPPPPSAPPAARLGVIHGDVDGDAAEVSIAELSGAGVRLRSLGRLDHVHASARRGALLGRGADGRPAVRGEEAALVVVDEPGDRRSGFRAALYRVDHGAATRLCGEVSRRSTPIVTKSGRVLIERGADGPDPTADEGQRLQLRLDELRIDEVDPWTGAITPRWSGRGYVAYLATTFGLDATGAGVEEIAVYFTSPTVSQLFALDPATGRARVLAPAIAPFARDFSWDATHARIVFADLAAKDASGSLVLALDPATRTLSTILASSHDHPSPFALPSGDLAVASHDDLGLDVILSGGRTRHVGPLGDGVDHVAAASPDARWVALRHTPKVAVRGEPPRTVAFDVVSQRWLDLGLPASAEVDAIGFLAGDGR